MKGLTSFLRIAHMVLGFFVAACLILVVGVAAYVWLMEPQYWAARYNPEAKTATVLEPQPSRVSPTETNTLLIELPISTAARLAPQKPAVWVNGKAYASGMSAAASLVVLAWPLWITGAVLLGIRPFLKKQVKGGQPPNSPEATSAKPEENLATSS
jgi:hypothetical protein